MKVSGLAFAALVSALALAQTPLPMPQSETGHPTTHRRAGARPRHAALTVDDICKLAEAKVSDALIAAEIKKNNHAFDLGPDDLIRLKKAGVSDAIVRYLMDPTQPPPASESAAPAPPAPPPAAEATVPDAPPAAPGAPPAPAAPLASGPPGPSLPIAGIDPRSIPAETGLYYANDGQLVPIDIKTLASAKAAGRWGHALTLGVKSVKTNAYLIGAAARVRVKETSPTFYFRAPEGTGVDELVLVSMYPKEDRREIEVAATSGIVGAKEGLRMESMRKYDSKELAPRLYRIDVSALEKGEYLFYIIGSEDKVRGIEGKGYDFGID
jgi:hypothetical protein